MKKKIEKPFYDYRSFLRDRYNKTLFRVPVNLAFNCPNRDKNGLGGCFFCGETAGKAVHLDEVVSLQKQVEKGIEYVIRRYKNPDLMLYFQAYTSTNAKIEKIRQTYETLLKLYPFKAITISTRPDCVSKEILEYFKELNKRYELLIELGLQTANNQTLQKINRGHTVEDFIHTVEKIAESNIDTAAHVILGLPKETSTDFNNTADLIAKLPLTGVKIHNFHIVKTAQFAKNFQKDPIPTFDEHQYGEYLINFIRRIPAHLAIMRLSSDTPEEILLAPKWWMKKGQFIDYIHKQMIKRHLKQGDLLNNKISNLQREHIFKKTEKVETKDGSFTLYNHTFKEHYHTKAGALSEAQKKFIIPSNLSKKIKHSNMKILDIGFGMGLNAITALQTVENSLYKLQVISLEYDKEPLQESKIIYKQWENIYSALMLKNEFKENNKTIKIIWGDARQNIEKLHIEKNQDKGKFDIVFLDPFSTQKNPELWTYDFLKKVTSLMKKDAIILTYSNAAPVRGAFLRIGMYIGETKPFGREKGGTIASFNNDLIKIKIPIKDMKIIRDTTSGLAYRDATLKKTRKEIITYREKLLKKILKYGIPKKLLTLP